MQALHNLVLSSEYLSYLAAALAARTGHVPPARPRSVRPAAVLDFSNRTARPVRVYLADRGFRWLLGTVKAGESTGLRLPAYLAGQRSRAQLIAEPLNRNRIRDSGFGIQGTPVSSSRVGAAGGRLKRSARPEPERGGEAPVRSASQPVVELYRRPWALVERQLVAGTRWR